MFNINYIEITFKTKKLGIMNYLFLNKSKIINYKI